MTSSIGPILVTGGCGFLGFHVVQALLKDPSCGRITVISRNPNVNIFDGVDYRACDVVDATAVRKVFAEIKPRVIIHTASPRPMDANLTKGDFEDSNIVGTRNLADAAQGTPSTEILIFSSSVNVIRGKEHVNVKEEDQPYWSPNSVEALPYWRSKAEAEKTVLAANSKNLKTVSLRLCLIIGLQEHALIPAQLDALAQGKTNIQLGDNKNLLDTVSAENAADAHLLAMHTLLDPTRANGKVDGEAFNITDANPLPFWDISRVIWTSAGDKTELKDVTVIPGWAANAMAFAAEYFYYFVFFGGKTPELNRHVVNFCTSTYTYDITKARKALGFNPVAKTEEVLKEAAEWELKRRVEAQVPLPV